MDQEIYDHLLEAFPDFGPEKLLNEDEMKSKSGKEKWRNFLMRYEKKVGMNFLVWVEMVKCGGGIDYREIKIG